MKYTYNGQPVSVDPMQRKADERRQREHEAAMEWVAAFEKAKQDAKAVVAERTRQYEESQKSLPAVEEDMRAIRRLLEAQQENGKNG